MSVFVISVKAITCFLLHILHDRPQQRIVDLFKCVCPLLVPALKD